ncbi:hypothetical protein [Hymenobacter sp. BRD67]|uniref:hypothetical protein n=1 Tax=Hymenobacter sp. BRD67 TaxID=2675877 RepID=UPI001566F14B|nr:hypothetical protein [Hymenobacter sp. BRD67]QKG51532.1 hypothetical protein GKZ67_01660 [Hymenobacter sp. BRD67]
MPAPTGQHGPLRFPAGQPFLEFADGHSFFAVGENLTGYSGASQFVPAGVKATGRNAYPPYAIKAYRQVFSDLQAVGGNFARVMLLPSSFEFEWQQAGNYTAGQNRAQDLDALFSLAEQKGIYLQVSAFINIAFNLKIERDSSQDAYVWAHNPYRQLPGVSQPIDVFRSPADSCSLNLAAEQLFANKLRYIVARWGYSPHLAAVELFNEFDNLGSDQGSKPQSVYWASSRLAGTLIPIISTRCRHCWRAGCGRGAPGCSSPAARRPT